MADDLRAEIAALCDDAETRERALIGVYHSPGGVPPYRLRALLAAHPVQVTTAEELDALPVGSVVLDGMGDAWQRSDAGTDWWAPANPFYVEADAANVLEQGGTEHPVTLLYRPQVTP